jgi:hypothetical protein
MLIKVDFTISYYFSALKTGLRLYSEAKNNGTCGGRSHFRLTARALACRLKSMKLKEIRVRVK